MNARFQIRPKFKHTNTLSCLQARTLNSNGSFVKSSSKVQSPIIDQEPNFQTRRTEATYKSQLSSHLHLPLRHPSPCVITPQCSPSPSPSPSRIRTPGTPQTNPLPPLPTQNGDRHPLIAHSLHCAPLQPNKSEPIRQININLAPTRTTRSRQLVRISPIDTFFTVGKVPKGSW